MFQQAFPNVNANFLLLFLSLVLFFLLFFLHPFLPLLSADVQYSQSLAEVRVGRRPAGAKKKKKEIYRRRRGGEIKSIYIYMEKRNIWIIRRERERERKEKRWVS
jgi:hypothetical protein